MLGSSLRLNASRTWCALSLFSAIVGGVLLLRPRFVFRPDGSLLEFGSGPDRSVFSFGVVTSIAAILSGFVASFKDLASSSRA